MKHGSLFSGGCDGFSLAAKWAGWQTVFQVEQNEFRQNTLAKNFPEAKRYGDIKRFNAKPYRGTIDIISGGFPCKSFSVAGKGAVDLTLWKEMLRTITEIKPPFVVAENVPGLVSRKNGMAFNIVCTDLENLGYEVQPLNIPIAGKGAPHERERIWFIAYNPSNTCSSNERNLRGEFREKPPQPSITTNGDSNLANSDSTMRSWDLEEQKKRKEPKGGISNITDTDGKRLQGQRKHRGQLHTEPNKERKINRTFNKNQFKESWYEVATRLCTMDDGLPKGLAKAERSAIYRAVKYFGRKEAEKILGISLKKVNPWRNEQIAAAGDAIVPQVAYEIFKAINEYKQMKL